jgi:hypothetical protein
VRKFEFAHHGHYRNFEIREEYDLFRARAMSYIRDGYRLTKNRGLTSSRGYVSYGFAIVIVIVIELQASMTPTLLWYKYVAPQLLAQHSFLFQGTGW